MPTMQALRTLSICFQKLMRLSGIHFISSRYLIGNTTIGRLASLGSRMEKGKPFEMYCARCQECRLDKIKML